MAKNQENLDDDDDDVPRLFGAPTVADRSAWIDAITAVAERQKLRRKSARLSKMARATRIAGTGFPALKIDAEATTVRKLVSLFYVILVIREARNHHAV